MNCITKMKIKVFILVMGVQLCASKDIRSVTGDGKKLEESWSWGYVDDSDLSHESHGRLKCSPIFAVPQNKRGIQLLRDCRSAGINSLSRQLDSATTTPNIAKTATTIAPTTTTVATTTTESPLQLYSNGFNAFHGDDPCNPYKPEVPDFSAPGRRISQVKCYEFIWNIKYRQESNTRMESCKEKKEYETELTILEELKKNITRDEQNPSGGGGIGGRKAYYGEFPHMAGIGWLSITGTWAFKCGGSLISPKFVLTAAHCKKAKATDTSVADPIPKIVRLGDIHITNSDDDEEAAQAVDSNIRNIFVHPLHEAPKKYYDIAILELDNEIMEFSRLLHPGCLWGHINAESFGEERATLTGWGVVETDALEGSPDLVAVDVDLVDSALCDRLLNRRRNRNWWGMSENQICAGNLSGGQDACQGDSGGPLQKKIRLPYATGESMHFIIGIISFGYKCALRNTPGVYTRVASFIDWIESIVWP